MPKEKNNEVSVQEEIKLSRALGLTSATMLGVGAMIGAGIFILSGLAAGMSGPAATISYLLTGFMTLFTALSYCELSSSIPIAGGGYTYVHEGIGGITAFITGWALIFGMIVSCALYAIGFAEHFGPLLSLGLPYVFNYAVLAAGIIVVLMAVNVIGTKESGHVQNFFTIGKVLILVVFVVLCFSFVDWGRMDTVGEFFPFGYLPVLATTSLIYISFFGFEQISDASEDIKNPEKNVPRAILLALTIPTIIYVFVVLVSVGILDVKTLGESSAPLAVIAGKVLKEYGLVFVLIAGVLSTISALNAAVLTTSRLIYAVSRDGFMPAFLSQIGSRFRTPHFAVVLAAGCAIVFAVMGEIKSVAQLTNFCLLFSVIIVNLSVIILRKRQPKLRRPFKLPFHPVIPVLGIVFNIAMMAFMEWTTYALGFSFLCVGGLVYFAYSKGANRTLERERIVLRLMAEQSRKEYRILVCLANPEHVKALMVAAAAIARKFDGDIIVLSVIEVPHHVDLAKGKALASERRPILNMAEKLAKREGVTDVRRIIKVSHRLSYGILETAQEEDCNFIVMGRQSKQNIAQTMLATVIDAVLKGAPCDVAVIKIGDTSSLKRVLVPVSASENSRLAAELAPAFAEKYEVDVNVFNIVSEAGGAFSAMASTNILDNAVAEMECKRPVERETVVTDGPVVEAIYDEIERGDLVIMGASKGGAWEQLLFKSAPDEISERVENMVITIKKFLPAKRGRIEKIISGLEKR
ncbi:MAG: amino acid permease [Candidatus Coatesbacteria bacterium]|nr:MAG: amino acid permease [Candidatus Coatesbacteria bacterium]